MNLNSPSNGLGGQQPRPPQQFNMAPAHTLAPYFAAHFGPHVMAAAASAANFSTTPVMTSPVNSGHSMNMSSGHLSSSGSSSGNSSVNSSANSSGSSTSSAMASAISSMSSPESEKAEKMTRSHQYKKVSVLENLLLFLLNIFYLTTKFW